MGFSRGEDDSQKYRFQTRESIRSCNGGTCVGLNVYVTGLHDRFRGSSSLFREGEYQRWKPLIGFPLVFIRITLPNLASMTFPSKRVKGDASRVVFHDVYLIPLVRYEELSKSWRAWWCWWCQRWGLLAWTKNPCLLISLRASCDFSASLGSF